MEILKPYRAKIDAIDDQIIDLLTQRLVIVHEVAALKKEHGIPAVLPDRVAEVIERCGMRAKEKGLDPILAKTLYTEIVRYCCDLENEFIKNHE